MKIRPLGIVIIFVAAVTIVFLAFQRSPTVSREVGTVAHQITATPAREVVEAQPAPAVTAKPRVIAAVPSRSPTDARREQIAAIYGMGEVFGAAGEAHLRQLNDFVERLSAAELPDALRELETLQSQNPTAAGTELLQRLVERWVKNDGPAAAAWVAQMPAGADRLAALTALSSAWAEQNFQEASAWAAALPAGAEKQKAQVTIAEAAVYEHPLDALNLAGAMAAGSERDDIVTRAAGAWAQTAPEDAVAWAKQVEDADLRQQVIAGIATSWAEQDSVAAGNLAVNSLPPGELLDHTVIAIVQRWAMVDPPAATAWANQFPAGEMRQLALATIDEYTKRSHSAATAAP